MPTASAFTSAIAASNPCEITMGGFNMIATGAHVTVTHSPAHLHSHNTISQPAKA